jgi:hypothetical protein
MAGEYSSAIGQAIMGLPQLLMGLSKFQEEQRRGVEEDRQRAMQLALNERQVATAEAAQQRLAQSERSDAAYQALSAVPGNTPVPEDIFNQLFQGTAAGALNISPPAPENRLGSTALSGIMTAPGDPRYTGSASVGPPLAQQTTPAMLQGMRYTIPTETERLRTAMASEAGRNTRADELNQVRLQIANQRASIDNQIAQLRTAPQNARNATLLQQLGIQRERLLLDEANYNRLAQMGMASVEAGNYRTSMSPYAIVQGPNAAPSPAPPQIFIIPPGGFGPGQLGGGAAVAPSRAPSTDPMQRLRDAGVVK